ncbi:MAG: hypothetical protein IJS54_05000 [Desulfovibrio sp.]|nr:hypothetical protein [Desulfovibrio sp.]
MDAEWKRWKRRGQWIARLGIISAFFFALAVCALLDGVQSLVRTETNEIRMLAGGREGLAGPCPFQSPVPSDLTVSIPKDAPLTFRLEGFFAGYLIGNGMWRGELVCADKATTATYTVVASFRGMLEGQRFLVRVFADQAAYNEASPSWTLSLLGIYPFVLAAVLGGLALAFAAVTGYFAQKNTATLMSLGAAEIFRTQRLEEGVFVWCSALGEKLSPGSKRLILTSEGTPIGEATFVAMTKGTVCQFVTKTLSVRHGCLVLIAKPLETPSPDGA